MDREELIDRLQPFFEECAKRKKPLEQAYLQELMPGDKTSYILQIKSDWIDKVSCSEALEFLFDVLWDTTTAETRERIFTIQLVDTPDYKLQCRAENNIIWLKRNTIWREHLKFK